MKLSLYILRTHVGPFFFSFLTLVFIFLLQFLMRAVDQLVGKGLSAWVIAELLALSLSWMVVLAVPMAVLVATLMAFGKLSSQNEITSMKASGVSLYRMMAPVILASLAVTYLVLLFNNDVLPEANHRFKVLMIDIRRTKPTLTLLPGLFSQDIQGYSIIVRKTFENSNDLEGVTIYDYTDPTTDVVVTAQRGKVSFTPDYRKLIMDLFDGEIHQVGVHDRDLYRRMNFTRHRIIMSAEGFDFERTGENSIDRGDRELSAQAMQDSVRILEEQDRDASVKIFQSASPIVGNMLFDPRIPHSLQTAPTTRLRAIGMALATERMMQATINNGLSFIDYNQKRIDSYLVEINKKYSIPAACLVFVFIGAPLGIVARRGTFGVAASLSLGFFVIYWASLIGGEKLADRGYISPWFGMWAANIFLSVLGLYLTIRMGRETPTIPWAFFRKFLPKWLRPPEGNAQTTV
ncbi:MAG TPA: LptF/LptG family permease [Bacteroidota bacterium]|nr:LptF/LptG family permease [Bacteroidota bacterium]